ncbi:hypothetical protein ACFY3M_26465 [Streptomyces mirabilis]|uniref:hypothetical protein n=1 Tax=Streptomyces mirabilis TaxID=68239 RepID=UPI0036B1E45E
MCRYCHLGEKLRLVLTPPPAPVNQQWPPPRLPLNLSGDTARIKHADGRGREAVVLPAAGRARGSDAVRDTPDLSGVPGTVCLPAPLSMSGDPCMGWGRWRIKLAWRWPQFGHERPESLC